MSVAQRLPFDPEHPFESSEEEQGHYANGLNARKAELMHQKKQRGKVMKSALRKNPKMSYLMSSTAHINYRSVISQYSNV